MWIAEGYISGRRDEYCILNMICITGCTALQCRWACCGVSGTAVRAATLPLGPVSGVVDFVVYGSSAKVRKACIFETEWLTDPATPGKLGKSVTSNNNNER